MRISLFVLIKKGTDLAFPISLHVKSTGGLSFFFEDIDKLNTFVMDCIRAVKTGKKKVGGLGYVKTQNVGCIDRGRGRNVKANRGKTESEIKGYLSIGCAQNALRTSRAAYNTLVNTL